MCILGLISTVEDKNRFIEWSKSWGCPGYDRLLLGINSLYYCPESGVGISSTSC